MENKVLWGKSNPYTWEEAMNYRWDIVPPLPGHAFPQNLAEFYAQVYAKKTFNFSQPYKSGQDCIYHTLYDYSSGVNIFNMLRNGATVRLYDNGWQDFSITIGPYIRGYEETRLIDVYIGQGDVKRPLNPIMDKSVLIKIIRQLDPSHYEKIKNDPRWSYHCKD